jgi:putative peptidoglycan lipid II flippase
METGQRQVARAAVLVMAAFAASRLLGLVRQVVMGAYYGTGPEMDAFVTAGRIPEAIFLVVAGGALGSAFIPMFTSRLARDETEAAWRLGSSMITILVALLLPISLLCIVLAPWLVRVVVAPDMAAEVQVRTVALMRVMLLSPTIFGVSGILMGILNAHQHFLLPALAPIVYNLGLILGAVWGGQTSLGAMGPAIGMVVGAVGHLLVQVPGLVRHGARVWPTLGRGDRGVREVGILIAPRVLGVAAAQINIIVITNLASRLGPDAISALNYAWMIMLLPQGVFAQAVGTAVFPTFSKQAALGKTEELSHTLVNAIQMLIALTIPASVGMVMLGEPIVATMFERGAFDATSTQVVAAALAYFALGLVGYSVLEVLGRAFFALHNTWTPALTAMISVTLNALLGWVLPPVFAAAGASPLSGLALAAALATLVEAATLFLLLRRRLGGIAGGLLIQTTTRVAAASVGMALALAVFRVAAPQSAVMQALIGVPVGLIVYTVLAWVLRVDQLQLMVRLLARRTG